MKDERSKYIIHKKRQYLTLVLKYDFSNCFAIDFQLINEVKQQMICKNKNLDFRVLFS